MSDLLSQEELDALLTQVEEEDEGETPASATDPKKIDPGGAAPPAESSGEGPGPAASDASTSGKARNVALTLEIPVWVNVELGRARMTVFDVLKLGQGAVIELDRTATDPISLTLNGRVVARGDAVVVNENFGVRVLEVESMRDRITKL